MCFEERCVVVVGRAKESLYSGVSIHFVRPPPLLWLGVAIAELHELIEAVIRMHVRLTSGSWKDAVHPSCDSPNTSQRFALGASNVCLVAENPTCSVPVLCVGMRGSMVIRLRPCMNIGYTT